MSNLNISAIVGQLGQDPQLRYTASGKAVTHFSVAVSNKSGDKTYTDWTQVVVWGPNAEAVNANLHKGDGVIVIGRMSTRSWEGKDGTKQKTTELIADEVGRSIRQKANTGTGNRPPESGSSPQPGDAPNDDDSVPF